MTAFPLRDTSVAHSADSLRPHCADALPFAGQVLTRLERDGLASRVALRLDHSAMVLPAALLALCAAYSMDIQSAIAALTT